VVKNKKPSKIGKVMEDTQDAVQNIINAKRNFRSILQNLIDNKQKGQLLEFMQDKEDVIRDINEAFQNIKDAAQNISQEAAEYWQDVIRDMEDGRAELMDALKNWNNNTSTINAKFGEDWFLWEDWRIDRGFMDDFKDTINRMIKEDDEESKDRPLVVSDQIPIIDMLHRKKNNVAYRELDIDKVIKFLTTVFVKYWHAIFHCHFSPEDAINSLKGDPYITFTSYIEFLKRNPSREK